MSRVEHVFNNSDRGPKAEGILYFLFGECRVLPLPPRIPSTSLALLVDVSRSCWNR